MSDSIGKMVTERRGPDFYIAQKPPAYIVRRVPSRRRGSYGKMVEEHWRMHPVTHEWECVQSEQTDDNTAAFMIPQIGEVDWKELEAVTEMLKEKERTRESWEFKREKPDLQAIAERVFAERAERRKAKKRTQFYIARS